MPTESTMIKIFVSSPDDVAEERIKFDEVILDLNGIWGECLGMRFESIKWERQIHPEITGNPGQTTINDNIGDYDIYVGILWKYFGTSGENETSGTKEEFEIARKKQKDYLNGVVEHNTDIMFYFSNIPHPTGEIDPDQLKLVDDFKFKVRKKGLYSKYNSIEDFKYLLFHHLSIQLKKRYDQIKKKNFNE